MAKRNASKSRVSAKAVAKLEVVAKASVHRKKIITEVVPPDVVRAKASAWLDLISPLTEWAGLRGDELRLKRDLLRLQREDVLSEIVTRAEKRLNFNRSTKAPIPNKFLVPFLEQASLEEPDSPLIDAWASLLVSASEQFSSYHVHFVSIISRLSGKQGEIFKAIIGTESEQALHLSMDNIHMYYQSHSVRDRLEKIVPKFSENRKKIVDDELVDVILAEMNLCGVEVVHAAFENPHSGEYSDIIFDYSNFKDSEEVDYSILEAVGLIRRVDTDFFNLSIWSFMIIYYHLTDLGFHFARACGIVLDDKA